MSPLLVNNKQADTQVSTAGQPTTMSPLLLNNHPAHTHVSIAAQHPPYTHPCLHCCSAPTKHTPMSPLLLSNHPAHTHVSIAFTGMKIPRVVPQNFPEIGSLTNVTWPPPWSIFSLYYGAGTPRRRRRRRTIWSCQATDSTPRKKISRSGPPHSDKCNMPAGGALY